MMDKEKAIKILRAQRDEIANLRSLNSITPAFKGWHRDTQIAINNIFGADRHIHDFVRINYSPAFGGSDNDFQAAYSWGLENADVILNSIIQEIETYGLPDKEGTLRKTESSELEKIIKICRRFPLIARQLESRHDRRPALIMRDEYDVQDLLHALIKLEFDDIRPEEYAPKYAGAAAKMDFLLKAAEIALEVKMTRENLKDVKIGEELIIDIAKYKEHPHCKSLVCFVYDPELLLKNPTGIERDLNRTTDGLSVIVIVSPQGK